ncbi:chemotaxis protein CheW [Pseudoalteromonas sp. SSDWG2]|uniref:chemotaxis protein CheW n=1 Tax=Pseudoalteromonas sp. SSDWG2 TaxID=3139391 RepID=UPI003BABF44E
MSGVNDKVMRQYLDALLTEDEQPQKAPSATPKQVTPVATHVEDKPTVLKNKPIEQLLAQVKEPEPAPQQQPEVDTKAPTSQDEAQQDQEVNVQSAPPPVQPLRAPQAAREQYMEGEFQALFFDVAGLTLAVPLKSLGGIHQLGEVNQLFGKPAWFKGVMVNRDEKIHLVDTARWVMPEKYDKNLEQALNYKYVIMLGESQWGLSAENLINNVTLKSEDVKWRKSHGKRPWLAGVIKDKMCALIDVENLQLLLEQGFDSQAQ